MHALDARRHAPALLALWLVACSNVSSDVGSGLGRAPAGRDGAVARIASGTGGAGTIAAGISGARAVSAGGTGTVSSAGAGAGARTASGTGGVSTGGSGGGIDSRAANVSGAGAAGVGSGGIGAGGASALGGRAGSAGGSTGGAAAMVNCSGAALTGGEAHCSSNGSGNAGMYAWSIWSSGSGGCITPYGVGAAFKATWNNAGDFLAREGLQWDETKTYDQYGTIAADYAYTKMGSAGGYSYIGIYGWSNNPLIEFYIVDDWYGSGPPTGGGALKGSLDVDGGTYKIYTHTQTNQPSIHGTATFVQFFSVRQTPRQCGHISITEHFKKWESLGMTLGKMYEAKLLIEAGGGSGSIDFTAASMTAQ